MHHNRLAAFLAWTYNSIPCKFIVYTGAWSLDKIVGLV